MEQLIFLKSSIEVKGNPSLERISMSLSVMLHIGG